MRGLDITTREEPLLARTGLKPTQRGRHGTAQNKQGKQIILSLFIYFWLCWVLGVASKNS